MFVGFMSVAGGYNSKKKKKKAEEKVLSCSF